MKKILIIDDDKTFQTTMTEKLMLNTYEIISAYDGEEGLQKAISEKPDLILLDIRMPKLDGLSLLKQLQSGKSEAERIPVIITSNLSSADSISEGVSLGVKGYIVKSDETLDSIRKTVELVLSAKKD